jgi:hypothetical protein
MGAVGKRGGAPLRRPSSFAVLWPMPSRFGYCGQGQWYTQDSCWQFVWQVSHVTLQLPPQVP